ncbi:MAG: hypothetical protein JWM11_1904 [Planctomycetaceae bacterium]|nr:hypothetical protein [Planctomycetaceae bacterium]
MGLRDSSKTRVQPVLGGLVARPTSAWLPELLAMGSRASVCRPAGFGTTGPLLANPPFKFEHRVTAPRDYLKVLLASKGRLRSAVEKNGALLNSSPDPEVRKKRVSLLEGDTETIAEGLRYLDTRHVRSGKGTWWVLEGSTYVDCALFAENATVFIEGKRTEPQLTESISWDLQRHQVFRNLDTLRGEHGKNGDFFVLLIVEAQSSAEAEARCLDTGYELAVPSWPHLSNLEARQLYEKHYLGYTTWQQVAERFEITLLDTIDDHLPV